MIAAHVIIAHLVHPGVMLQNRLSEWFDNRNNLKYLSNSVCEAI